MYKLYWSDHRYKAEGSPTRYGGKICSDFAAPSPGGIEDRNQRRSLLQNRGVFSANIANDPPYSWSCCYYCVIPLHNRRQCP